MYKKLIKDIDLKVLSSLEPTQRVEKLTGDLKELVQKEKLMVTQKEIVSLAQEIYLDSFEFGPITPLIKDPDVTEIMINSFKDIYIEKGGRLSKTGVSFRDDGHLKNIIDKILGPLGLRVDESFPMADARLKDGSRINVAISPISLSPMVVTIRKFKQDILKIKDLISLGMLDERLAVFLSYCVNTRMNIIISGGTSTGKTTLLNVLSNFIPSHERIVTIEDTLELNLNLPHVVSLESRPPNIEGRGAVSVRNLVKNSLRMRPDRIIVGEIRGLEAIDVLQAMNTGHSGSLSTLHSNSPQDLVSRLETLLLVNNLNLTPASVRRVLASSLDLVVHLEKAAGKKIIQKISKLNLDKSNSIKIDDIYIYGQDIKHFYAREVK